MPSTKSPFRPSQLSVDLAEWIADSSDEVQFLLACYRLMHASDDDALVYLGERLPLIARELLHEVMDEPSGAFLVRAVGSADFQEVAAVIGRRWSRSDSRSFLMVELDGMRVRPARTRRAG